MKKKHSEASNILNQQNSDQAFRSIKQCLLPFTASLLTCALPPTHHKLLSQHHHTHHRPFPITASPSASSSPSLHCHKFHRPVRASPQTSLSPLFAQLVFPLWFLSSPLLSLVSSVIVSQDRSRSQGIDSSQLPTRQPRILPPQPLAT